MFLDPNRQSIIDKVRVGLGTDLERRRRAADAWLARPPAPSITLSRSEDTLGDFIRRARAVGCTAEIVTARSEVSAAIRSALTSWKITGRIVAAPDPLLRAYLGAGFACRFGRPQLDDQVSIAIAAAAIAETGTLAFCSGSQAPTALAFLPEYLIAIAPISRLVRSYEQTLPVLLSRDAFARLPRCVNFITGPSRTADIEEILLIGAHGPRFMTVLMIDDSDSAAAAPSVAVSEPVEIP
jgi:L-lactate dehydrogenase complex protein LldG